MSGVEAAGLALAVFPIVIGLLDRYQDGYEKLRDWVLFRREFTRLVNDLHREQILFQQHVESTLRSVTDSEFELMKMMEDPQDLRWKSEVLAQRFRRKLSGSGEYENYMSSMGSIYENLNDMSEKLKRYESSDDPTGAATRKRREIQKQFRRFQFSLGKKRWHEQVVDLGRQIDRIGKLHVQAEALAPSRQSRNSAAGREAFRLAKHQASSLHRAISRAWTCGCEEAHTVQLLMGGGRQKVATAAASGHHPGSRRSLTVSFPSRPRAGAMPRVPLDGGDSWRAFETTMISSPVDSGRPFLTVKGWRGSGSSIGGDNGSLNHARRLSATASTAGSSSTASSGGGFSSSERPLSREGSVSVITIPDGPARIENLCQTVRASQVDEKSSSNSIGYLEDGQGARHAFHADPSSSFTPAEIDRAISLQEVLARATERHEGPQPTDKRVLSRRQRMSIALTIAYAVLELYPTPWLPRFCGKAAVHLFQHKDGDVLAEHPFVLCEAAAAAAETTKQERRGGGVQEADHGGALLTLGILIMELWFGQTIESRLFWRKCCDAQGNETEFTSLMAAMEWQKMAKDEAGVALHDITSRCIRGNFGLATMNLNEAECVGAVYDYVVKPLEELLSHCWPV